MSWIASNRPVSGSRDSTVALGHGHAGLTGGPASGHLVAQLVAGERPTIDPTPYHLRAWPLSAQ